MVIGASWNGARAFTSTSGPGISLMNELLGLAYYAEIPAVVVDVQRVGPSTGMPTRTQQGDLIEGAYASHGDTKHILLFPANPAECFEFAAKAFDLAERFQTPVFLMSDLDIGMNDWVVPRLTWDDAIPPDRGRVLTAEDLEKIAKFQRYNPEDENHVAARTLPGVHSKGAYFTRGSGHNKFGGYTEIPDEYQEVMDRLLKKHKAGGEVRTGAGDSYPADGAHVRRRHPRRLRSGRARSAGPARRARHPRRLSCASADSPSATAVERFLDEPRLLLRRRAESRRATALAADARNPRAKGKAALRSGLRRFSAERRHVVEIRWNPEPTRESRTGMN